MFVTVNNQKIYFNRLGNPTSEKTILFVHGSAMSGRLMEDIANLLPYNNITLDLPGHVHSEGEPLTTVEDLADFLSQFITELKKSGDITDDLTVAGYSLGGCISLELALRGCPDVTRIAVLNSCDFANSELATVVTPTFEDFSYPEVVKIAYGKNSNPMATSSYFAKYKANAMASYIDLKAAVGYQMKEFHKIHIPTIFIAGYEDRIAPIQNIITISEMIPHSVLSVIPFHGHMAILEVPDIYARNIHDFIRHN